MISEVEMTKLNAVSEALFGSGQPPLPEEPTFHRHRPERGPDFYFYIVVGGLLFGSLAVNYAIHRLQESS